MKNLKKLAALLLALLMTLTMTMAFAEEGEGNESPANTPELGSITINGVSEENAYSIYRLLDLESYNTAASAYAYTVNEDWANFFKEAETLKYFAIDADGYVTWIGADDGETIATFAKGVLSYAVANDIDPIKSSKNDGEFAITGTIGKFNDLPLGYYLIDSTMGALCGLTTTNPNASVNAKNAAPTIDKQVKEDSTSQWGDSNSADIGQIVEFRTTINVHEGAQNFVLHDSMSAGLTFMPETVKVEHVVPGTVTTDDAVTAAGNYELLTSSECDNEDCTFEIQFTKDFCDKLETNDKIIVYYNAMLNRNAVVGADAANPNTAKLEFGEKHYTTPDATQTFTFGIDIVKTDGQNTLIDGAKFKIYDAETGGNEIKVVLLTQKVEGQEEEVPVKDEAGRPMYRRAREDETGIEIAVTKGQVRVVGFDNGTYYLEETEAPDGYNRLTARQKFIISDKNLDATFNDGIFSTGSGVHVVNKTGAMLPETGGIGTTLFYVFGGVMAAAAVILLVTKKRMSNMA